MRLKYVLNLAGLRIEKRRPAGTEADVEHLRDVWQHLLDLDCGHDYECPEYEVRNAAVNDAVEQVSAWQEWRVFRTLQVRDRRGR